MIATSQFASPLWSPDGKRILFVEADQSAVRRRSVLVPVDPSYPDVDRRRFARVGEVIASLRVGIVEAESQALHWLPIEVPPEGYYLGQVEWAGNSDEVLVEKLSRFRDQREFLLWHLGGEVKRIYHESNPAWCISSQRKNLGLTWIRGGQAFIVISERDGWRHATVYLRDGKELALLTQGPYDIIDFAMIDGDEEWYYFYASPENATERYLYRVPLDGSGDLQQMTPSDQAGTHDYDFSPDADWAIPQMVCI